MTTRVPAAWQKEIDSGSEKGRLYIVALMKASSETGIANGAKPCRNKKGSSGRSLRTFSQLGVNLRAKIEAEIGRAIGCGSCIHYLYSLNMLPERDAESIAKTLYAEIEWPKSWREEYSGKEKAMERIRDIVNSAIEMSPIAKAPSAPKPIRSRKNRRGYTGWRSETDGPRIVFGPFASNIRHLTYHVWAAKKHDSWRWNLEQLAKRWRLFNGKRIIGISHDDNSEHPETVLQFAESLGMNFDLTVVRRNDEKLREVVTWLPMLHHLNPESAADDEVVFSAHAKGQKYDDPGHTRDWTDLMYQSCLDDWPSVHEALRTSLMAGSFREYGLLGKWHNWAYSGTFFWWRLREIGKRKWFDIDQWFAGTESWPGKLCDPSETACLFLNDSRRMYDGAYWKDVVWPEWKKYLEQRG